MPGETSVGGKTVKLGVQNVLVIVFSAVVAVGCLASLGALIAIKVIDPNADASIFLNIFLTTLGYIVGILAGLLGVKTESQSG